MVVRSFLTHLLYRPSEIIGLTKKHRTMNLIFEAGGKRDEGILCTEWLYGMCEWKLHVVCG